MVWELQRFADEKTERATPERRREARREGRVAKSPELTSAIVLLGTLGTLKFAGPNLWNNWYDMMQSDLSSMNLEPVTQQSIMSLFVSEAWLFVKLLLPILSVGVILGIAVGLIQVGPTFVPKLLLPNFERVQPLAGLKRLWSMRTGAEAIKSVVKLAVVGSVGYLSLRGVMAQMNDLMMVDLAEIPGLVGGIVFQVSIKIAGLLLALALLDFLFQRFDFERSIRMSRQEIKEEMKRQEGDPQIKARVRQRGRALAMRRMMQEVPKADVVVTNPTHFAVALRYDAAAMSAPVVVAKGQDEIALRIRSIASEAGVMIVENRPLARSLFRTVEVGGAIPADLYQAVAQVLAYVYKSRESAKGR